MLSAEPLERLAPAIVAIDLRMADIQCVGFFQDLLQGALLITSSYRCGYCPSGISTINPSESGVRLTWHASRELGRASTGAPEIIASSVEPGATLPMRSPHAGSDRKRQRLNSSHSCATRMQS